MFNINLYWSIFIYLYTGVTVAQWKSRLSTNRTIGSSILRSSSLHVKVSLSKMLSPEIAHNNCYIGVRVCLKTK